MKIAVIGPGALGTLVAAHLGRIMPEAVTLLDHNADRAALLRTKGLTVTTSDGRPSFTSRLAVSHQVAAPFDLGLVCVKSHAIAGVLDGYGKIFNPDNLLVVLANGIAHLDILAGYPDLSWAVGVTALGANLKEPGRVVHAGNGPTRLGFTGEAAPRAHELLRQAAATLSLAGLPTAVSPHILADIWGKLLVNVGINALTAIHDCPNGAVADHPHHRQTMRAAVLEAAAVARAKKILIPDDPVARTLDVCRATAANLSSMLQDIRRKRPTEIDAINGAVVKLGRRLGIPTPVNEILVMRIKTMESLY